MMTKDKYQGFLLYYHDKIEGHSTANFNKEDAEMYSNVIKALRLRNQPYWIDKHLLAQTYQRYRSEYGVFPFIEEYVRKYYNIREDQPTPSDSLRTLFQSWVDVYKKQ